MIFPYAKELLLIVASSAGPVATREKVPDKLEYTLFLGRVKKFIGLF